MFAKLDYVMIIVSDMQKSIEFYRDKLGLKLSMETPGWTEFDTGTTTLALHGGGQKSAPAHPHENQQAGTCSVGFYVENIHETHKQLEARGVHFIMPPTERDQEGIMLAVCVDPDGLGISMAQPLKHHAHQ